MNNLGAEYVRFVMQKQQCMSSLADPRPPTRHRDLKGQPPRRSRPGLSIRTAVMQCSVRITYMVLVYQK